MIAIDMRIIFAEYGLSVLLCLIVMVSLWWQNRKRSPEIILWLIDYILQFAGIMLIMVRGILPDFVTIVIANLFIVGGTVILYEGLCRYVGQEAVRNTIMSCWPFSSRFMFFLHLFTLTWVCARSILQPRFFMSASEALVDAAQG